jgi:hypothetical protein
MRPGAPGYRRDQAQGLHSLDEQICSPDFLDEYTDARYGASPMVEYLSKMIGLNF